jgi:hypothetical protein
MVKSSGVREVTNEYDLYEWVSEALGIDHTNVS